MTPIYAPSLRSALHAASRCPACPPTCQTRLPVSSGFLTTSLNTRSKNIPLHHTEQTTPSQMQTTDKIDSNQSVMYIPLPHQMRERKRVWLNSKEKLSGSTTPKVLDLLDARKDQTYSCTTRQFNRTDSRHLERETKLSSTLSTGKRVPKQTQ